MKLTKEQIEVVGKLADELKKCANNQSYIAPSATIIQLNPGRRYKEQILLLIENTNLGDRIEKDFAALDKIFQEYESWRFKTITEDNKEEFELLVNGVKGAFYDLSDTLRQIISEARKERKVRIIKQASAVVGFIATVLAIVHYLKGWFV